jgi:hypothetical protein
VIHVPKPKGQRREILNKPRDPHQRSIATGCSRGEGAFLDDGAGSTALADTRRVHGVDVWFTATAYKAFTLVIVVAQRGRPGHEARSRWDREQHARRG